MVRPPRPRWKGSISVTVPQAVEGNPYTETVEELESLVGTQSDAELNALATDDQPAELLADENGNVIAGFYVEPEFTVFAIGVRGPGCASGDACVFNGANVGYYGTGIKDITLSGVTRWTSGSYTTTLWRGSGDGDWIGPNKAMNYTKAQNMRQISRS